MKDRLKFPSDQYQEIFEVPNYWMGPCEDSWCFGSCVNPHCRYEYRLGKTPKEHNVRLREMREEELEACLERIIGKGKEEK